MIHLFAPVMQIHLRRSGVLNFMALKKDVVSMVFKPIAMEETDALIPPSPVI